MSARSPVGGRARRGRSSFFKLGTRSTISALGLILPFEIIYLHQARGFRTATAGLVLAALLGTAAVVTPPSVRFGPAVGGAVIATSPDAVWWGGALTAALIGAGLLRLGDRIPDPLLQTPCAPPQAAPEAT